MGLLTVLARLGQPWQHGGRRSYSRIAMLLREKPLDSVVKVNGWVKAVRRQKERTFIDLDDGSGVRKLQVVLRSDLRPAALTYHAAVSAEGVLRTSTHPAQEVELVAEKVEVVGGLVEDGYPFNARKTHPPEYTRKYPHLRARTNNFAAMLRVRAQAKQAIHEYFTNEGFTCIDTPVLTANDCEGGGETFMVQPTGNKGTGEQKSNEPQHYFGQPTHLTVSGQLHLEAMASCLSKVYNFNPAFRAENSHTRRHLAEFWMVEAEEAFLGGAEGLEGVVERVEGLVKGCVGEVLERREEEVKMLWSKNVECEASVTRLLSQPFIRMTYNEALTTLASHTAPPSHGDDLGRDHEQVLVKHAGGLPVLVTNWPKGVKAFYMAALEGQPNVALAVDLLLPDVGEVAGGGVREPSPTQLLHNLPPHLHPTLDWYVDLRRRGGAPPTAGFGLGFERLLQFIVGAENIRDVIPFPRWAGHCMC